MSIDDYRTARALIDQHPDESRPRFMGERPDALVAAAEQALGVDFPPSYRAFVKELGAGGAAAREFYGITSDNFTTATIPNGIWLTLQERQDSGLPDHLIVVFDDGDGSYLALDTSRRDDSGENPVVEWIPGASGPGDDLDEVAPDFGALFRERVQEGLAGRGVDVP